MKRIISIFLCVAMLMSMVAMTVGAYGAYEDQITTENVMTFTTDKESYKAGDTVKITVAMESIWGDPTIEDNIYGYEDVLPGAYGMNILCAALIYDTSVFTAKAHKSLLATSTIKNADATEASVSGNNPIEAKANGAYYLMAESDIYNLNYDGYGYFTGSGDLWQYNLQIAADAAPGTYYLPVGPYRITDGQTEGSVPVIKFADEGLNDRLWAWNGNVDSLLTDRAVEYKTGYTGPSRVAADSPMGSQYECSYVVIKIDADVTEEDVAAAAEVDALIDAIGTVHNSGSAIKIDAVNHDGLYTHIGDVPATSNFSINFKMMPIGYGEGIGYLGGWTNWSSGDDTIFWNAAEQKFMIGTANGPVNATEVLNIKAQSDVMDLPTNKWTDVEFIYNGSYMGVKVNGAIVCETNSASTGYNYYIFYPSDVLAYVKDMKAVGAFGEVSFDSTFAGNTSAYIPTNLDSGAAITAAQNAYDALSAGAKTLVTKKDVLDAAVAEYAAIAAYYDQVAADKAIAMIDAIGTVTYPGSGDAIVAAEAYCATLTETQLGLVTNYEALAAARAEYVRKEGLYNQAKADYVIGLIDAIGEVTFESRDAIELAEKEYDKLTDVQKALVTNYETLTAARAAYNLYAPIMNVENLINNIGDLYIGETNHFNWADNDTKGYYNFPDRDGDNCSWGANFSFDFMYVDANKTAKGSNIGFIRNGGSFAGYDFKTKSFVIASGGGFHNSSNGVCDIIASKPYDLVPGVWYNMTIDYAEDTRVASVYLNGELMVQATPANTGYEYLIFYPQQVDMYIKNDNLTFGATYPYPFTTTPITGRTGDMNSYIPGVGVDILSPVDFDIKITAAEKAMAALTEDQLALLADSYKTALADARTSYNAMRDEIIASAAAVVDMIAAIETPEDTAAARAAYNALLPTGKTMVTNYADLEAFEASYVVAEIDALGEITPASAAAVAAAEASYAALTDGAKALVSNYETLTAARTELNALNAAVANAQALAAEALGMFTSAGTVIKNVATGDNSYSQFLDKAENLAGSNDVAPYSIKYDFCVEAVSDAGNSYIGGSSSNDIFVGYDLVRKTFFIANAGPWGYSSGIDAAKIYAEAAYDIALNTWYTVEYVLNDNVISIIVDGEQVVTATLDKEAKGWFIYYPKNNTTYYDNVEFTYNGVLEDSTYMFTGKGTACWVGMNDYSVSTAPVAGKYYQNILDAADAAFAAVPEKAQYAVTTYPLINTAIAASVKMDVMATVPTTNANNYKDVLAMGSVIAEAKAAYAALDDALKARIDAAPLDAAIASYGKAVNYDSILNGSAVEITATAVGGVEKLDISWTAVPNAVKYWVYVDGAVVAATTSTEITVPASAGDHKVKVTVAVNDTPELGSATTHIAATSAEVDATVVATPVPEVYATATENSISVNWNAVDGATVYYVTFNVGGTNITVKTTNTAFTLAKYVTADTEYSVVVKAYVNGKFVDSAPATGRTDAPSFVITGTDGTITWGAADGATIYWVTFTNKVTGVSSTYKMSGSTTEFAVPASLAGTDYSVVVKAYVGGKVIVTDAADMTIVH